MTINHVTKIAAGFAAVMLLADPGIAITPAHAAVGVEVDIGPNRAPPRIRREVRPARPHPGWAWRTGHWDWRDRDYVWVGGEWTEPPRARAAWIAGHWAHRGRNWVWVDGHWA